MSLTYTAETYTSGPLSTTTEYKLSDGSRWVRIVEEYIAPDMKARKRTRVLRSDFPGDKEHRDTLTNLQGAIANADVLMYVDNTNEAPVKLDTTTVTGAVRPADEAPAAYVIEPGYEEQALPLTTRQIAVLEAIHKDLHLTRPLDVIPAPTTNDMITASAEDPSRTRFTVDIDPDGYLGRVAVRYEVAGMTGWTKLGSEDPIRDAFARIARNARMTTPANSWELGTSR